MIIAISSRGEQKNRKTEKIREKIIEKTELWKKSIKPIKILKNRPVRFDFGFISLKSKTPNRAQTEKTEPNRQKNRAKIKKPSETGKNWAKLVWTGFFLKNQTKIGRFEPVSVRFQFFYKKINLVWLLFFL